MWTYWDFDLLLKIEIMLLALAIASCLTAKRTQLNRTLKKRFLALSNRPWLCTVILLGLSLGLNAALSTVRWPSPRIQDEFSYALAADTFASGRLSNPVHPMGEHFESFHILSQPTVTSKYPPANSLFMALGQVLTGQQIVGVWISLALAIAAMFWLLRAWTTPPWALFGSLLLAIHTPLLHAWGQSYWGGAAALLGGALVFGGIRRIFQAGLARDFMLCGLGLVLLANARPMEGFLISVPVFGLIGWWFFTFSSRPIAVRFMHGIVPLMAVGAIGIAWILIYNHAVTGHVTQLPYQAHDETYAAFSMFIWGQPPETPPSYNHERIAKYFLDFRERQMALRSPGHYLPDLLRKLTLAADFYPIGLGVLFLTTPLLWKRSWFRFALLLVGGLLLVHTQLITSWVFPHYLAPVAALYFALSVAGLRYLWTWRRKQGVGKILVHGVMVYAVLRLVVLFGKYCEPPPFHPRQVVEQQLLSTPGKDLVIVSYSDQYSVHDEWVYNDSDIDASAIVYARDMGQDKNQKLIDYFAGRRIWRWNLENENSTSFGECDTGGQPTGFMSIRDEVIKVDADKKLSTSSKAVFQH